MKTNPLCRQCQHSRSLLVTAPSFPFSSQIFLGLELKALSTPSPLCGARCPSHSVPPASLAPISHSWPALVTAPSLPALSPFTGIRWTPLWQHAGQTDGREVPGTKPDGTKLWRHTRNSCSFHRRKSNPHSAYSSQSVLIHRRGEVQVHCSINILFAMFSSFLMIK